jgi:outer membrane protein OmpA-like peptidoglycan-associated protein
VRIIKKKNLEPGIGSSANRLIALYLNRQTEELHNDVKEAQVRRYNRSISIVLESDMLFSADSSAVNADSHATIQKLSRIFNRFADTGIVIEGHTDNSGTKAANKGLSEKRAETVATLLSSFQVSGRRLRAIGYGETKPVATNKTKAGRHMNRRIEMHIHPDNELIRQAQAGELRL